MFSSVSDSTQNSAKTPVIRLHISHIPPSFSTFFEEESWRICLRIRQIFRSSWDIFDSCGHVSASIHVASGKVVSNYVFPLTFEKIAPPLKFTLHSVLTHMKDTAERRGGIEVLKTTWTETKSWLRPVCIETKTRPRQTVCSLIRSSICSQHLPVLYGCISKRFNA